MSLQSSLKSLELKGRAFIKLIRTALSNTDFSQFGVLLTANACLCKMQWLLVHFLGTVFIRVTTPTVFPVIDFVPSVQISIHLFQSVWRFIKN
jgi:hypothetical protein